jgi:Flp pilus assembly protein TadG
MKHASSQREEGVSATIVGLTMTVLLMMSAIALNYSMGVTTKQDLQNGTDAAALNVAQTCALDATNCNSTAGVAAAQAQLKGYVSNSTVASVSINSAAKTANVESRHVDNTILGNVVGSKTFTESGNSTASWGNVAISGNPTLPLGIGYCDWQNNAPAAGTATGATETIYWNKSVTTGLFNSNADICKGTAIGLPTTQFVNPRTLWPSSYSTSLWMTNDWWPGINTNCNFSPSLWDAYAATVPLVVTIQPCMVTKFQSLKIGDTILIPIYSYGQWAIWGFNTGITTSLSIVGYAPFKINSFVPPTAVWPFPQQPAPSQCNIGWAGFSIFSTGIGQNCVGIQGTWVRTTRPFTGWTYGTQTANGNPAYDLGAHEVRLVPNP